MKNKRSGIFSTVAVGLVLSTTANATLYDRGNGMIYDSDQNLTWLQDANYAKTSEYDADGLMGWDAAVAWAENLVFGNYSDWRLPTITDTGASGCNWANSGTDCGYNIDTSDSELAYMYHVNLGLESYYNEDGSYDSTWGIFGNGTLNGTNNNSYGQNNVGLVENLQSYAYWSGTEYAPGPNGAWLFDAGYGSQVNYGKLGELYAWAVRSGDVAAVPTPATALLFGLGLLGVMTQRRRRR